jgi:hypothetical protein
MGDQERKLLQTNVSLPARVVRSLRWRFRLLTSARRALPDFVIIGGQRCGTTSLYEALSRHRIVAASFRKEIHYFDIHHARGEGWYRANFPIRARLNGRISGEATPNYLAIPEAPGRMAGLVPDVRLVALLRNPVERAHSAWKLRTYERVEKREFARAIEDERAGVTGSWEGVGEARQELWRRSKRFAYLDKSRYAEHLARWREHFASERLLIIQSEKLFSIPEETLGVIEDFLGLPHDPNVTLPRVNYTRPSQIDTALRKELVEYFAPFNSELEQLAGQAFDWH